MSREQFSGIQGIWKETARDTVDGLERLMSINWRWARRIWPRFLVGEMYTMENA
jgi:hypothetical protein